MKDKKFIALCFLSIMLLNVQAQNKLDSLRKLIQPGISDSLLVFIYSELALEFEDTQLDSSLIYAFKAKNIAENSSSFALKSMAYNAYGVSKMYAGKYQDAEKFLFTAKDFASKDRNIDKLLYANISNNLASLFIMQAKYANAQLLLIETADIYKKLGNKKFYATAINNLASIYYSQGYYNKAEPLFAEALEIWENIYGKENLAYAKAANNLALLYYNIGVYSKSELLFRESLKIRKNLSGDNTLSIATVEGNLALLLEKTNRFSDAENLYKEVLSKRLKILGENHPDYLTTLNNFAIFLKKTGRIDEAEKFFKQVLESRKAILGEEHPLYILSLENLAGVYFLKNSLDTALTLLNEARQKYIKTKRTTSPSYFENLKAIAEIHLKKGNVVLADSLFWAALKNKTLNAVKNFSFLNEIQREEMWLKLFDDFNRYNSFVFNNSSVLTNSLNNILSISLFTKGLLVKSNIALRKEIYNSGDTLLVRAYEKYVDIKEKKEKKLTNHSVNLAVEDSIDVEINKLERYISLHSKTFKNLISDTLLSWQSIRPFLKNNEVFVDFVQFTQKDETCIAALVFDASSTMLKMVKLGCLSEIYPLISLKEGETQYPQYIINKENNKKLYELLFKPLVPFIKKYSTVYIFPVGILNNVSWPVIQNEKGEYIFAKQDIQIISNVETIKDASNVNKFNKSSKIAIFGGINFNESEQYKENYTFEKSREYWGYLEGTYNEAIGLFNLFMEKEITAFLKTGNQATEEAFKKLDKEIMPDVIHLATHGYHCSKPDSITWLTSKNIFETNNNPMYRNGLLMAGANRAWNGLIVPENIEDGVLTASEVANQFLSNTKLVVLSACETGLGDIKGNEGVYGLIRAFKMAGVKNIIVSLWQVPDAETAELMTLFYSYWLQGNTFYNAFKKAQLTLSRKYSPYYWGGFVLIE